MNNTNQASEELSSATQWSTILKPSSSMPNTIRRGRGIFLGWTKDKKFIKVVVKPNSTYSNYAPEFWQIDTTYMSDREQIAELMGRIHECNEPSLVRYYRDEIDTIQRRINDQSS